MSSNENEAMLVGGLQSAEYLFVGGIEDGVMWNAFTSEMTFLETVDGTIRDVVYRKVPVIVDGEEFAFFAPKNMDSSEAFQKLLDGYPRRN